MVGRLSGLDTPTVGLADRREGEREQDHGKPSRQRNTGLEAARC
jgi:hypothetical protein